jgi:hypothetical protein
MYKTGKLGAKPLSYIGGESASDRHALPLTRRDQMKALMFVCLLTVALATAAQAAPTTSSYQYPHYPQWASNAFETQR